MIHVILTITTSTGTQISGRLSAVPFDTLDEAKQTRDGVQSRFSSLASLTIFNDVGGAVHDAAGRKLIDAPIETTIPNELLKTSALTFHMVEA